MFSEVVMPKRRIVLDDPRKNEAAFWNEKCLARSSKKATVAVELFVELVVFELDLTIGKT